MPLLITPILGALLSIFAIVVFLSGAAPADITISADTLCFDCAAYLPLRNMLMRADIHPVVHAHRHAVRSPAFPPRLSSTPHAAFAAARHFSQVRDVPSTSSRHHTIHTFVVEDGYHTNAAHDEVTMKIYCS